MNALAQKECAACRGQSKALEEAEISGMLKQLAHGWQVVHGHQLEREFKFKNFREALDFTNEVGDLAEEQNHHPDIYLAWGKVRLTLWTHSVDGLTESDFVFAAKVDDLG